MLKSEIILMYMNIKLVFSNDSFKQLKYFSMENWKKLETLRVHTFKETSDIKKIKNAFDFPLLRKL